MVFYALFARSFTIKGCCPYTLDIFFNDSTKNKNCLVVGDLRKRSFDFQNRFEQARLTLLYVYPLKSLLIIKRGGQAEKNNENGIIRKSGLVTCRMRECWLKKFNQGVVIFQIHPAGEAISRSN